MQLFFWLFEGFWKFSTFLTIRHSWHVDNATFNILDLLRIRHFWLVNNSTFSTCRQFDLSTIWHFWLVDTSTFSTCRHFDIFDILDNLTFSAIRHSRHIDKLLDRREYNTAHHVPTLLVSKMSFCSQIAKFVLRAGLTIEIRAKLWKSFYRLLVNHILLNECSILVKSNVGCSRRRSHPPLTGSGRARVRQN